MRYNSLLTLFILLAVTTPDAMAADRYRVEVLVLQHLNSSQEAKALKSIRDYSDAQDFLTPGNEDDKMVPEGCAPEVIVATTPPESPVGGQDQPATEPDGIVEEDIDPNAVIHVPDMGAEMQEAWRRLRLSGPFRPLQFLAWEQGSEEPFPELRLHDLEVVFIDDPYADLREIEIYKDGYANDAAGDVSDETACVEIETDPFPEPTLYYALDGTVSLKRSRFLHLNLDLQWREAVEIPPSLSGQDALPDRMRGNRPVVDAASIETIQSPGRPVEFRVHSMEQSRQVRSSRMEYFDGPVIGVLAWITTIVLEESAER